MHKRVVLCVSTLLFALLAATTWIVTELHDRGFPVNLTPSALVNLDFGPSSLSDERAFAGLGEFSDRLGLGLLKVAPDLSGDQQGQVFVSVGAAKAHLVAVDRFGNQPDAAVWDRSALENSYASGQYLVTGDITRFGEVSTWLRENEVVSRAEVADLGSVLRLVAAQDSFLISLVAVIVLLMALVLYWLSVKARGRALRVLSGTSEWRVHAEDLVGFLLPLLAAASVIGAIWVIVVAATQGASFVPYYAWTYALLCAIVLVLTAVGALVMSAATAPNAAMLAARRPAVSTLRRVSLAVKALTFVVVLAAVAPAFHALNDARMVATQQAKWRSLSDQVALSFPAGLEEAGFVEVMPQVGALVAEAVDAGGVALSYTWNGDDVEGVDLDTIGPIGLVDRRWIDLMIAPATAAAAVPATFDDLPPAFRTYLDGSLPLWSRTGSNTVPAAGEISIVTMSDPDGVPLAAAGGGDLIFPRAVTLIVVDNPHQQFNDDFLTSLASSANLVFDGLGPTRQLLTTHGLARTVDLRLVAEDGVLRAQVAEYTVWLRVLSLAALTAALVLSAVISAFIVSLLNVRRDFPLRLAGRTGWEIVSGRLLRETALGGVLLGLVALTVGGADLLLVLVTGFAALLAAPLTHLRTAGWAFSHASGRKL